MNSNTVNVDSSKPALTAEAVAQALGGVHQSGPVTWKCDCPVCGYRALEVFTRDNGEVGFVCYSCRDAKAILEQVQARGLIPSGKGRAITSAQIVAGGLQVWAAGVGIEGTEAATYFASRGLLAPYPDKVRFVTEDWQLVCLVEHPSRGVLGVHVIKLTEAGRRKVKGLDSIYRRYGMLDGGGVWIGTPGGELVVGEGLETTLSAMALLERSWGIAALGAAGMKQLDLPDSAERVCIAADNDINGDGQCAAAEAKARWLGEGRTVRVATPDTSGTDFNDLLMRRARP